jgi:outer membrane lipoprotein SlyB
VTGKTELSLAFDSITMRDGRTGDLRAEVTDLVASESVKSVDEEGNIETASRTKDTAIRSGGGAALGAIIGAIAGGGKGAAIGALIGAGVGAGSVFVQGDKDLILEPGTEMEIRTMGPANTRR